MNYINIAQQIQEALRAFGPVDVTITRWVPMPWDGPLPRRFPHVPPAAPAMPVPFLTKQYLAASNIRSVSFSDLTWGEDKIVSLPDVAIEKSQICQNFSALPSTQQQTLTLSFSRTSTIAIQQTVQHTTTGNVNFKLSIVPGIFDVGGSLQITDTNTTATTNTEANQVTVTSSSTESVNLPPHSAVLLTIRQWTVQHQLQFTCQVVVEADLSNNDKYKLLSEVLNESQRTFTIQGTLYANDCSQAVTTQIDAPLPQVDTVNFLPVEPEPLPS